MPCASCAIQQRLCSKALFRLLEDGRGFVSRVTPGQPILNRAKALSQTQTIGRRARQAVAS